jgi:hypothetical protein
MECIASACAVPSGSSGLASTCAAASLGPSCGRLRRRERPGLLAIEVKAASRWTERDLAGLRAFLERTPRCRAAIMAYNGVQAVRLGDKLWAVPLSTLLG